MTRQQSPSQRFLHGTEISRVNATWPIGRAPDRTIEHCLRRDLDTALKCLACFESPRDKEFERLDSEVERLELVVAELSQENEILVNDIQDAAAEAEEICESLSNCHDRVTSLEETVKNLTSELDLVIAEQYLENEIHGNSTSREMEDQFIALRSQEHFRFSKIAQEQHRALEAMMKLKQQNVELEKENARLAQLITRPGRRGQKGGKTKNVTDVLGTNSVPTAPAKEPANSMTRVPSQIELQAIYTTQWLNIAVDYFVGIEEDRKLEDEFFSTSTYRSMYGLTTTQSELDVDKQHRRRSSSSISIDNVVCSLSSPDAPKMNAVCDPFGTRKTRTSQKNEESYKLQAEDSPQEEEHLQPFDLFVSNFYEGDCKKYQSNAHYKKHQSNAHTVARSSAVLRQNSFSCRAA
jgi:hypothetical protein